MADLINTSINISTNLSNVLQENFSVIAGTTTTTSFPVDPVMLAVIGAGIAVGASGIASAIGAGIVGNVGAKKISENPKNFSTALLFQALPQTQGIYGFLIGILILLGAGVIGGAREITLPQGLAAIGAGLAVGLGAVSAIGQGTVAGNASAVAADNKKAFGKSILFSVLPETQALYGFIVAVLIMIGTGLFGASIVEPTMAAGWASIAAGLAAGLGGISAIGQGMVASSGIAATNKDPKSFGKSILFSVLPETQALYGFIVGILILIGFGVLGGINLSATTPMGIIALAAAISAGLGAISAIGQSIVSSSGIDSVVKKPKMFGKAILFSVLPETQALYGFLIAILLLVGGGILGAVKIGLTTATGIVAIGASLAVGIAAVSAIGQGQAASSATVQTAKKSEMFGKSIIFSIIPETQALMGFLIAILLMIGAGLMGAVKAGINLPVALVAVGSGLAVGLAAISAIGQGFVVSGGINAVAKNPKLFGKSLLFGVLPQTQSLYGFLISILLLVGGGLIGAINQGLSVGHGLLSIGAGICVGLAAISAIGQGIVATSGITAISRKNKLFGKAILFSVLPETQALYGFLVSVLLLIGGGLIGAGIISVPTSIGLIAIGAGLAVGFAAISAIGQGIVAASGIESLITKAKAFGKSILFSVLPETQALYGFLIAILLLVGGGLLGQINPDMSQGVGIIAIAAGIAVGIAAVSAVGQGQAAATAATTTAQNNKMFGKSIIFSIIPETQALMGFLVAILMMIGAGLMGAIKIGMTVSAAFIALGAGLAVGLAAISAIGQGFVISTGINAVAKDSKLFGKSLLFSVLPQTQSLYGFLIAMLLLVGGGLIGAVNDSISIGHGLLAIGAGVCVGLAAISAIGQGIVASGGVHTIQRKANLFGKATLFSVLPETQALYGFLISILLLVGGGLIGAGVVAVSKAIGLIAIGAGLAVGIAAISAIGQGIAAASGIGAVNEDEKMFGKSILFSVLPETQALYGTIVAILLLTGSGLLGIINEQITLLQGIGAIAIGLTVGLAALSALGQGVVSASSIAATLRTVKSMGKGLVLSVIPETYAIFGLLISILILIGLKII